MGPSSSHGGELHALHDHGALPYAAKIRTKNLLALLCLTQEYPNSMDLSSKTGFNMCASGNSVFLCSAMLASLH